YIFGGHDGYKADKLYYLNDYAHIMGSMNVQCVLQPRLVQAVVCKSWRYPYRCCSPQRMRVHTAAILVYRVPCQSKRFFQAAGGYAQDVLSLRKAFCGHKNSLRHFPPSLNTPTDIFF